MSDFGQQHKSKYDAIFSTFHPATQARKSARPAAGPANPLNYTYRSLSDEIESDRLLDTLVLKMEPYR
jgi:hypothetical protein